MTILQEAWEIDNNTLVLAYNLELANTINLKALIKRVQISNSSSLFSSDLPNTLSYRPVPPCNSNHNCIVELRALWLSQTCFYECDFDTNLLIFGVVPVDNNKLLYSYGQRTEVIKITDKPSTISLLKAVQASEEMLSLYDVEVNDFNFSKFISMGKKDS